MSQFAKDTKVAVSSSKIEIEKLIEKYGAGQFASGWSEGKAMIAFTMKSRQVRFIIPMPQESDFLKTPTGISRNAEDVTRAMKKSERQRWRAMVLILKAKLEAIESGFVEFEDEFLANIVMPNGRTVSEEIRPSIEHAYETGAVQPLLPDYT